MSVEKFSAMAKHERNWDRRELSERISKSVMVDRSVL